MKPKDYTLDLLLDLNGLFIEVGLEFWVKIEAKLISNISVRKPFGIKYSLTLHASNGERLLGYDNAHGLSGYRFSAHDHIHKLDRIMAYEYQSAEKLLSDFWSDVEMIIKRSVH